MVDLATIYVVDDDESVRDSIGILLSSHGMDARIYSSARDFLDENSAARTGCLVADLHMPEMTGLDLLEHIRKYGPYLPVIVMTGRGDPQLRERAERAGAFGFLEKPLDGAVLMQTIRAALDTGAAPKLRET